MARLQNTFTSLSTLFQSLVDLALVQTVYVKCKVLAKLHRRTARCLLTFSSLPDIPPPPNTPLFLHYSHSAPFIWPKYVCTCKALYLTVVLV